MSDIVKNGYVKRYSKSVLSGGWNQVYLSYHRDTRLNMYKKQGDYNPQLTICMKDVCKYFAYGEYTNGMPNRPTPPSGTSINCLMGIPTQPSAKSKIIWFLFHSEAELHDWMNAITSVLPPPTKKDRSGDHSHHHQPQHVQPVGAVPPPPPHAPAMPYGPPPPAMHGGPPAPGGLGFENLSLGPSQPVPAPYQPNPQAAPGYPTVAPGYPAAAPPPHGYPAAGHPPPPPAAYPTQPYQQYPAAPYGAPPHPPAGGYYPSQPPVQYAQGGQVISYPQQTYHYPQQRPTTVVYQQQPAVHVVHHKKGSSAGHMAAGIAGGALLGYGASRMMGGGWGLGRWGSWSSMSSFGSCGSFGSFSSFGSFD